MAELNVSLEAMDREVWVGKARIVVATTPEGQIGIMPGHEPILALLVDGELRIETADEQRIVAAVHGGFFSVANDRVSILAETAELGHEIDVERAQRALDRILAEGKVDRREKSAELRARTRLKAAMGTEVKSTRMGS